MCLALPGKIIALLNETNPLERSARVDFSGIIKEISLAYLPEADLNDYVMVHAGMALSLLDQAEAAATLAIFAELAAFEQTESYT